MNWVGRDWKLSHILKVIKKLKPPSKATKPITEDIILDFKKHLDFSDWTEYTLWVLFVLAYSFALRSCEYVETDDNEPVLLNQINFEKTRKGQPLLVYTLPKSKTNQSGPPEILMSACCCPRLCAYHTLLTYTDKRIKLNPTVNPDAQPYLFLSTKSKKVPPPKRSKKKYKYVYKRHKKRGKVKVKTYTRFKYTTYTDLLKIILAKTFGKNYNTKAYHSHSFRYGGVTDLAAAGLSGAQIRGISRHAPNSLVLYRYIRLTPTQVARIVKNRKLTLKFKKKKKQKKPKKCLHHKLQKFI